MTDSSIFFSFIGKSSECLNLLWMQFVSISSTFYAVQKYLLNKYFLKMRSFSKYLCLSGIIKRSMHNLQGCEVWLSNIIFIISRHFLCFSIIYSFFCEKSAVKVIIALTFLQNIYVIPFTNKIAFPMNNTGTFPGPKGAEPECSTQWQQESLLTSLSRLPF